MFSFNSFNKKEDKIKNEYILSGYLVDPKKGIKTQEFAEHIPADSETDAVRRLIAKYNDLDHDYQVFNGEVVNSNNPDLKIDSSDLAL